ncbi:LuxR C-terminal-related transcriptional regulator [Nitratidesulfovibrio sp. 1201_IL3209]|uniref:LuxR C-terminal-related transcriptional regulator n=1 Tax=Nitratidesulfovibrio sp. 1201_IL3209 TaxID=3084053 RepID=UPI002FD943D6
MPRKKSATADLHYYSERLKRKLLQLRSFSAALVEAPSGHGKTTAVRGWLESSIPRNADVYWFTAEDEAPEAGYRRLCREIGKIDSRAGERLLKADFPNAFTLGEACDALRSIECGRETWLVIDNFQCLLSGLPPAVLAALVEHGGKELHVVIITQPLDREHHNALAGRNFLRLTATDLRLEDGDVRRYYAQAGLKVTEDEARRVQSRTGGWMFAVSLQLRAFRENGTFSDAAVQELMERLIWDRLSDEQQTFLLRLSLFETATVRQMCDLLGCDALPDYAERALSGPLIRHDAARRLYEPHTVLLALLARKRAERGTAFERACLLGAGDLCRSEGRIAEALGFYHTARDYARMLSLDLSRVIFAEAGGATFFEIAQDIVRNCPAAIRREHPLALLQAAWALKAAGRENGFGALLDELDRQLDQDGPLRAEWLLLSAYRHFPQTKKMLPLVRKAAPLFGGSFSRVILPDAPWAFGQYFQLSAFHLRPGEADREADALEAFINVYSQLTGGHGSGADSLFRAEAAYFRGDFAQAEVLAYKTLFLAESARQSTIRLGAARLLADLALLKADTAGWQRAVGALERAASACPDSPFVRPVLDIIKGAILSELQAQTRIADWLKNGDFPRRVLLAPMLGNALYVHVMCLLQQGEYARFIGTQEALPKECIAGNAFSEFLFAFLMALGHSALEHRDQAAAFLEQAAEKALPDGFVLPFAASSSLLQGLAEELVRENYPAFIDFFTSIKGQFETGWVALHDAVLAGDLPSGLSAREREIAELAAQGLRNHEIAARLGVADNTVRAHLRAVFQKLDIDRRARLAEKLQ